MNVCLLELNSALKIMCRELKKEKETKKPHEESMFTKN